MRKLLFLMTILLSLSATAQHTGLGIGVNGGFSTKNADDIRFEAYGFDINYLFSVNEQVSVGIASGYINYIAAEVNGVTPDDSSFIPIAGSIRFNTDNDRFFVGGDLGYAFAMSPDEEESGLYFKPMVGYNFSDSFNLNLFYSGVRKEDSNNSYMGLGLMFRL